MKRVTILLGIGLWLFALQGVAKQVEVEMDLGMNYSQLKVSEAINPGESAIKGPWKLGYHLGIGARRQMAERHYLGVKLEAEEIEGHQSYNIRAFDYQYVLDPRWRLGLYFGAVRLDYRTPAYGYHLGAAVSYRDFLLPNLNLVVDLKQGITITRDKLTEEDPQSDMDTSYDILGTALYLSYRF